MSEPQHVVGLSGGKDSTAVACLAIEWMEKRGRDRSEILFLFADTGNEDQITHDHIAYLGRKMRIDIRTVRADFSDRFAARRAALPEDWRKEKRRTKHRHGCLKKDCDCPVRISPPVSEERIAQALATLHPTGNPFLDICMLKGRFPSRRAQFCTEELKVVPINQVLHPILERGQSIIQWMGERAEESPPRAKKPVIHRVRHEKAAQVFYRPVHKLSALQCFEISKRHGLAPNPLYKMNMSRVGCLFCVNCAKGEIVQGAQRLPHNVERIARWEEIVTKCSRRGAATFFPAPMIPGDPSDETRAGIRKAVDWAKTSRGGRQYDLLQAAWRDEADEQGAMCESAYGLCE